MRLTGGEDSYVIGVPVCHGEERGESKCEVLDLLSMNFG